MSAIIVPAPTVPAAKGVFAFGANAVGTITSATSWMEAGAYAGVGLQSTPRGHIAEVACEIYAATEACGTRDAGGTGNAFYEVFLNGVATGNGLTVALNSTAGVGIAMTPVTLGAPIAVPAGTHVACKPYRTGSGTGRSNCTVTYFARAT